MKSIWKKYIIICGLFGLAGMVGSLIYFGYEELSVKRDKIPHHKKYAYYFDGRTMNPALIVNDQESAYKLVGYYDRNDSILPFNGSDFNTIPVGNEVEVLGYFEDSLIVNIKAHKDRGGMDSEMTGYVYSKTLHDYLKELKPVLPFDTLSDFNIISFELVTKYPSSDKDTSKCEKWSLTDENIKQIIKSSHLINSIEWDIQFSHLPCAATGHLIQNDKEFNFSVNSGSWMTISDSDTTIMLGYFDSELSYLFLDEPWDGEEGN